MKMSAATHPDFRSRFMDLPAGTRVVIRTVGIKTDRTYAGTLGGLYNTLNGATGREFTRDDGTELAILAGHLLEFWVN